jgi:hypothetical protein
MTFLPDPTQMCEAQLLDLEGDKVEGGGGGGGGVPERDFSSRPARGRTSFCRFWRRWVARSNVFLSILLRRVPLSRPYCRAPRYCLLTRLTRTRSAWRLCLRAKTFTWSAARPILPFYLHAVEPYQTPRGELYLFCLQGRLKPGARSHGAGTGGDGGPRCRTRVTVLAHRLSGSDGSNLRARYSVTRTTRARTREEETAEGPAAQEHMQ